MVPSLKQPLIKVKSHRDQKIEIIKDMMTTIIDVMEDSEFSKSAFDDSNSVSDNESENRKTNSSMRKTPPINMKNTQQ